MLRKLIFSIAIALAFQLNAFAVDWTNAPVRELKKSKTAKSSRSKPSTTKPTWANSSPFSKRSPCPNRMRKSCVPQPSFADDLLLPRAVVT